MPKKKQKRMIFLSFASLIRAVIEETIPDDALIDALFFFKCGRQNTRTPDPKGEVAKLIESRSSRGTRALAKVVGALDLADEANPSRSHYRGAARVKMSELGEFLCSNGYHLAGGFGNYTVKEATRVIDVHVDDLEPVG